MKQPDDRSRRRFLQASSLLGLAVAFGPGTTGEAFADSQSKTIQKEDAMTQGSAAQRGSEQVADKTRPGAAESAA
jgi:nitrous oxide reductase